MARHAERDWDQAYAADRPPPWDIGRAQPAIAALIDQIDIESPVLDAGCGTGALAIDLAERGHRVIGIDASEPAIAKARAKAAERDLEIDFMVADATRLTDLGIRPKCVFDSGLLHSLDDERARAYVAELEAICDPGSFVCILAMSSEGEMGWGVTADELVRYFPEPAWVETRIEPVEILAGVDGEELHPAAYLLTTTRA